MKIIILGAGLIGVSSAYFLRKKGYEVTVIDRQADVALETSYANGGQVSVCYSEPWSNFSNIKKIFSWIGKEDSPILFKPHMDKRQFLWGLQFLYESLPFRNHKNIKDMLKIALYSRNTLQELRSDLNLEYNQLTKGILTFYSSEKSFQASKEASLFIQKYGCDRQIKSIEETYAIEPVLKNCSFPIYGSDFTAEDESGDAKLFTQNMKKECIRLGVEFIFNQEIVHIESSKNKIQYVETVPAQEIYFDKKYNEKRISQSQHTKKYFTDTFVCALGSYTSLIAGKLGIYLPIYPAKGYSATLPILNSDLVNQTSLTDSDKKIVLTRLGDRLRIAGTAEFNGYNLEINHVRCDALVKQTKKIIPEGLDYERADFWTGLRPATPGNVPIIKQMKYDNFFINSGHGTLGWTMAAGSGKLISQIISKEKLCQ